MAATYPTAVVSRSDARRQRAFSLIELVIVVVIIGIVADDTTSAESAFSGWTSKTAPDGAGLHEEVNEYFRTASSNLNGSPKSSASVSPPDFFSLSNIGGLTDGDWLLLDIFVDDDGNGDIDPGETTTVGGAGSVDQGLGRITFSSSFNVSAATHYILRADFPELSDADRVTIDLDPAYITASLTVSGTTTSVIHREGCLYTESYQVWSVTNPDTWEVKDLSSAPFNVPANALVEVAVRNSRGNSPRYGGVRAAGSGLDRRFLLHEAEQGGLDVLVMHVQTDSSSQIQHYSDATNDVDFVLLGYWDCGTYVEAAQLFNAGVDALWQPRDLSGFGVGPGQVVEVVMINTDGLNEWEAGVRAKGSSLERRLALHEPEGGGLDTATMVVVADSTASATIEVYAQDDLSVDFYLVGYWTTSPRPYTQKFTSIASPAVSATWEDLDLTAFGVPGNAVAEIALANTDPGFQHNMGVRANGSSLGRMLDLHEAEDGGADLGRMHVAVDGSGLIEFYQEDVGAPHAFYLTGYWGIGSSSGPPKIVSWREVDPN